MSSDTLYLNKGFFVKSKNGKITDDYTIVKVNTL